MLHDKFRTDISLEFLALVQRWSLCRAARPGATPPRFGYQSNCVRPYVVRV